MFMSLDFPFNFWTILMAKESVDARENKRTAKKCTRGIHSDAYIRPSG
jgi:hypothetical protein